MIFLDTHAVDKVVKYYSHFVGWFVPMVDQVSKSEFKAKALELFRRIETSGESVVITDHGRPKLEVRRYEAPVEDPLAWLRGKVIFSDDSIDPVGEDDWEILK